MWAYYEAILNNSASLMYDCHFFMDQWLLDKGLVMRKLDQHRFLVILILLSAYSGYTLIPDNNTVQWSDLLSNFGLDADVFSGDL